MNSNTDLSDNPFSFLKPVPPELFIGQWNLVHRLAHDLKRTDGDSYVCIGGRRFGKSSLFAALSAVLREPSTNHLAHKVLPIIIDCKKYNFTSPGSIFAVMLRELYRYTNVNGSPAPKDQPITRIEIHNTRLDYILSILPDIMTVDNFEEGVSIIINALSEVGSATRIVLLMDEFDDTLRYSWHEDFYGNARTTIYDGEIVDSFRLVLSGSSSLMDEVNISGSPLWNVVKRVYLTALNYSSIVELCQRAGKLDESIINAVWNYSGGHPFLAQYLLHSLWENGIDTVTAASVTHVARVFLHSQQAHLKGWVNAIGVDGLRLYEILLQSDAHLSEEILLEECLRRSISMSDALIRLIYHGVISHNEWSTYCWSGHIFRSWYEREGKSSISRLSATMPSPPVRPQHIYHVYGTGEIKSGDTFHMSGDFSGTILNIKNTLTNTIQTINGMAQAAPDQKQELARLLEQLQTALTGVPAEHEEAAETVAETAKELVEKAAKDKPNKTTIQITADGLKAAATNLAAVVPTILPLAGQIAQSVQKLIGG